MPAEADRWELVWKDTDGMENKVENNNFDMEQYIRKRMLEITRLKDRELYKNIVGDMLLRLYKYNQEAYRGLEERLLKESTPDQADYAIYLTMTDRKHYDATDAFMHPMREEDSREQKILTKEVNTAIQKGEPFLLYTLFLQTKTSDIRRLLREERTFTGVLRTEKREYRGTFALRLNETYLDMVKALYYIFAANNQPWTTVCEAYLTKLMDVYLCTAENIPDQDEIVEIRVDFEEYADVVRYEMIPLWNLRRITRKTSTYPNPCIDKTNYEHQIFAHLLKPDCEYLVMNTDVEITNIRRQNGDLLISCSLEKPCEWELYQVNRIERKEKYFYPVLGNRYKESFSGKITEMYRKSIKTKAEMARLMEAFSYDNYVFFRGMEIKDIPPEGWEDSNYNMDGFIQDEIRVGNNRQILHLSFSPVGGENYLNEDIMSFLVTQVQKIFPEYLCIGSLGKEA